MTEYLKCSKCGAVMVREDYHEYAWYLDGQRVEGCPPEVHQHVQVGREDLRSLLAALEAVDPHLADRQDYRSLRAALEGN